jgi:chemotaxis-related protein WspD
MCWYEVGMAGDRSCEKLGHFVHCRNCPEYSNLGRTLLDRPVPEDYRQEMSEELAVAATQPAGDMVSVVVFRLGPEWFALRTGVFHEIANLQPAYALPFRSGGVLAGMVNVNGELLLCVSLPAVLGLAKEEKKEAAKVPRLCVVDMARKRVAFGVDEVLGVRRVPQADLKKAPATLARAQGAQTQWCLESDGHSVGLIDEEKLFDSLDRSLRW